MKHFAIFLISAIAIIGSAFWWVTSAFAGKPSPQMCLNPGSYIFTKKGNDIYRMKMDAGLVTETVVLHINLEGASPDENIAANYCYVFFSWARPGQQPDIWVMNASTGLELRRVTNTPDKLEMDPVLDHWNGHIAYTEVGADRISSVAESDFTGVVRERHANASTPAWGFVATPTYTQSDGWIYLWKDVGSWHTYLPDGKGILYQQGPNFFIDPRDFVVPYKFGEFLSVAFRPKGSIAAVITTDGDLETVGLDSRFLPAFNTIRIMLNKHLSFVTWISVP